MKKAIENGTDPQSTGNPIVGSMDLAQLRLVYGDNYGTSGYGVVNANPGIATRPSMDMVAWLNNCKKDADDPKKLLSEGIEPLKTNIQDYNSFKSLFGRYDAEWSINLGSYLLVMKIMTSKAGLKWESWAEENLSFINTRNRQRMMLLAKRQDCHPYNFLGVDRLELLCAATAESQDVDPIGSFMSRHGIVFKKDEDFVLEEFKDTVDTALNTERLSKGGIEADPALVKNLTLVGAKVDKSLVKRAKDVMDSGGDINKFLKTLSINKGKSSTETDEEKRLQDFNSLANRLIATVDYILRYDEQWGRVDVKALSTLMKRLGTLQKVTPPADEKK